MNNDKNLEIKIDQKDQETTVYLIGVIDEDSNFDSIISLNANKYIFNFKDVSMINSCGVREWINFIEKIPASSQLIYQNCPQVVIEQINMVHGFIRKGAQVETFYAPYYSEKEDQVKKILLHTKDITNGKAPSIKDPQSEEVLEFDAIEAQYFNFLKQMES